MVLIDVTWHEILAKSLSFLPVINWSRRSLHERDIRVNEDKKFELQISESISR